MTCNSLRPIVGFFIAFFVFFCFLYRNSGCFKRSSILLFNKHTQYGKKKKCRPSKVAAESMSEGVRCPTNKRCLTVAKCGNVLLTGPDLLCGPAGLHSQRLLLIHPQRLRVVSAPASLLSWTLRFIYFFIHLLIFYCLLTELFTLPL